MKILKSIFPVKSKTDLINEKDETLTNELFVLSLTTSEIALVIQLVKTNAIERIQHEKTVLSERLEELDSAEKILKRV